MTLGRRVWTGLREREIRFQILIPDSVAAATHWSLGLKAIWLIWALASNSLEGADKSVTSQMLSFLSLPPVATYFPSLGEMETAWMCPS
jgi:hypothetical protein